MKSKQLPLLTAGQAARLLNVSPSRVSQLKLAHGMPFTRTSAGDRFDADAIVAWYLTFRGIDASRDTLAGGGNPISDLDVARARKTVADAELAELNLATKRGQVVAINDVVLVVSKHIGAARARLLSMGATLGPVLAAEDSAAECQHLVDEAVREALEELAGSGFDAMPGENS